MAEAWRARCQGWRARRDDWRPASCRMKPQLAEGASAKWHSTPPRRAGAPAKGAQPGGNTAAPHRSAGPAIRGPRLRARGRGALAHGSPRGAPRAPGGAEPVDRGDDPDAPDRLGDELADRGALDAPGAERGEDVAQPLARDGQHEPAAGLGVEHERAG